jgi:hypothetical protein
MNLPETTIFVTTIGDETNFADCMEHLQSQTVQRPIEVIDHVAPMSSALQQMHVRCTAAFYVQVDEDMILFPDAIAKLETMIREASPQVAMICAPVWDCDTDQPIYGVKIYRHEIVRRFPYQDSLSCETQQLDRIKAAGFEVELLPLTDRSGCLGEHGKHYSPETIFRRWQRLFHKHEQLGHRAWIEPWAERLLDRYIASKDETHLYAFLGAVAGIAGDPAAARELDWREPNAALSRIQRYFPVREKSDRI